MKMRLKNLIKKHDNLKISLKYLTSQKNKTPQIEGLIKDGEYILNNMKIV